MPKQRAAAQFTKPAWAGDDATSDYEADADLVAAKIARLKGLRLARDAAAQAAPPKPAAAKKAGKTKKQKKRPALSLLDWMNNRQAGAHNH